MPGFRKSVLGPGCTRSYVTSKKLRTNTPARIVAMIRRLTGVVDEATRGRSHPPRSLGGLGIADRIDECGRSTGCRARPGPARATAPAGARTRAARAAA